ncbi:hypothetical protein [Kozakia baliensis]|uniref:hypothetical protein n=1 Tax=Kozakia baliensis TaxID=153496 RepID=UPI0013966BDD|nr:hypothetical protein [Kozakia baliensis]
MIDIIPDEADSFLNGVMEMNTAENISALLEIRYDGFSKGFMRDPNSGYGRQNNEDVWSALRARRSAIPMI